MKSWRVKVLKVNYSGFKVSKLKVFWARFMRNAFKFKVFDCKRTDLHSGTNFKAFSRVASPVTVLITKKLRLFKDLT